MRNVEIGVWMCISGAYKNGADEDDVKVGDLDDGGIHEGDADNWHKGKKDADLDG